MMEEGTCVAENTHFSIALMPRGGSKGPSQDAYRQLVAAGEDIAWYYTMFLHPLPPKLLRELRDKDLILVPELNYLGQFSSVLRSQGVRAESITLYTGLPFKVSELMDRIGERVRVERQQRVAV